MSKTVALIVAAGRGHRFGGELPKQYVELDGAPVLRHTAMALLNHPKISVVRAVIHPDDLTLYEAAVSGLGLGKPIWGGDARQDSVRLGLEQLADEQPDFVLIHDAARPFVSDGVIDRVVDALANSAGAIPALALTDTIKRVVDDRVVATEDRNQLWRAQTPQGFHFTKILDAHRRVQGQNLTDDAAICEAVGLPVARVDGDAENIKITTLNDLNSRSQGKRLMETRTGFGFDVHRFTEGNQVVLCGIEVPHSQALEGHSDADVGLHALTDALLGAIGAGDIGQHFPPSDPQWRGVASDKFVAHAVQLIKGQGARIVNVDITLICEAPKIGPVRLQMRDRVAEILNIDKTRINVKATTTENLGFTGRREGIAAQATANIEIENSGELDLNTQIKAT